MTPGDAGSFAAMLAELGEVYGEDVSAVRARLYFEALSAFTLAQLRRATRGLVQSCRFFPKPVDFFEQVMADTGRPVERPALYPHVEQDHPRIKAMIRSVLDRLGARMTP